MESNGRDRKAKRREEELGLKRDAYTYTVGRGCSEVSRVVSSGENRVACVQPPLGTRQIPQCAVFICFNFISPAVASSVAR